MERRGASLGPHSGAVEEEAKYEIDEQKKVVPEGMEWIILKAFSYKIDKDGGFGGYPDTLPEYLLAIEKGTNSGWL